MKELNCKLIVSDFDGTLANSQNEVPDEVKNAINNYIADGGIFAVCSGRILPSVLPRVRRLGLKGLVIACQGSVIADIESGEIIKSVGFKDGEISEICAFLEELNTNVQAYYLDGFYSDLAQGDKYLKVYEDIIGVTAHHADIPLSEFAAQSGLPFNKAATLCSPDGQKELFEKIKGKFGTRFDVTCSAKVLIEISPFGETKGEAVKFLSAHYGVPIEKCCAIGDNLNDLSMIEAAGVGVAVGNAVDGLKAAANYVAVSNDEGAVARVIEKFGYIKND
ncbi:MAG: Cof-type HAD-IIB family hydrolase [Clostridia bacterium]|nr:Cof-type HAD-IIB family hydrolase [Clostridia bacterium]